MGNRLYKFMRGLHITTGLAAALGLSIIALTGILINHQEELGLLDLEVDDKYLPDYYRADLRTGSTRLNIIITDIHTGKILGSKGYLLGDLLGAMLIISALSGTYAYFYGRRIKRKNGLEKRRRAAPDEPRSAGEQVVEIGRFGHQGRRRKSAGQAGRDLSA